MINSLSGTNFQINKPKKQSFKGIPVGFSNPEGLRTYLYQVEKKDFPLIKKLLKNLDVSKSGCETNLKKNVETWQKILNEAFQQALEGTPAFIAMQKNSPCGILTFNEGADNVLYLFRLGTWNIVKNEPIRLTGQSLMRQAFETAATKKNKFIAVEPKQGSTFNQLNAFYQNLGFKPSPRSTGERIIDREGIEVYSCFLDDATNYRPIKQAESVNLSKTADTAFLGEKKKSFFDKILSILKRES